MNAYFDLRPTKNNKDNKADKEWYFNLVAANGKIICTSEVYQRKQSALNGITAVKAAALNAATKITLNIDIASLQED